MPIVESEPMTHDPDTDTSQPVFHGAAAAAAASSPDGGKLNKKFVAGVAVGIGSAAVAAALLYARRGKPSTKPRPSPEPSD